MALSPGTQIADYRVISQLGQGGMGEVYLVENPQLERREALKVISVAGGGDSSFQQRFTNEARTAAKLNHPNIITIHRYGIANGAPWFSMSFVEGKDLATERLTPAETATVITDVADALDYAHRHQVIHRDIKPANIMVTREPGTGRIERIVVLDFGIAKLVNSASLTGTHAFIGTLAYSAPEVIDGADASPASDQYALACTAYTLITGQAPFPGDTPSAILMGQVRNAIVPVSRLRPDLPGLDHVFARAFARNPTERFPNCRAFAAALRAAISAPVHHGQRPVTPPPPSVVNQPFSQSFPPQGPSGPQPVAGFYGPPPTPAGPTKRRTGLIVGSVLAVIALLVAAGVGVFFWNQSRSGSDDSITTTAQPLIATDLGTTCAVSKGKVSCWGDNSGGQLGNDTTTDSTTPVQLATLDNVTAVATGSYQTNNDTWNVTTCAVANAEAYCWGNNQFGQVGNGQTQGEAHAPVKVPGLTDVTSISTSYGTTCAVAAGEAYCWGDNDRGQLGTATPERSATPIKIANLSDVTMISTGYGTTCAVADATLSCWGDNSNGQVGNGSTTTNPATPTKVSLNKVTAVTVGGYYYDDDTNDDEPGVYRRTSCAIADDKGYCWGDNTYGQIGDGTTDSRSAPTSIKNVETATSIATAWGTTCLASDGAAYCWGDNKRSQLGFSGTGDVSAPRKVDGPSDVTAVTTGTGTSCALVTDGAYCWGQNDQGQVGDGTTTNQSTPHKITI